MAISDFFSGGQTPDYLSGLLDDEQLRRLKQNAQQNALMQFGLSALSQGGYSQTPVGIGEILGKSGMAGMQGYQQGVQSGIEGIGTRAKLEELQRAKKQKAAEDLFRSRIGQPNATRDVMTQGTVQVPSAQGTVAPNFQTQMPAPTVTQEQYFSPDVMLQEALSSGVLPFDKYLELSAKQKTESPFAKVDPSKFTTESINKFNMTGNYGDLVATTEAPSMTDEPSRVAFAKFGKRLNQLNPQQVNEVNKYIEQSKERVAGAGVASQRPGFKDAGELRREFKADPVVKTFNTIDSAYKIIKSTMTSPSAAGDLAGVTKFMKLLDPESVVRESEVGMARNANGLYDRLSNYYNRITTGEVLTPDQRKDFLNTATQFYDIAREQKASVERQYSDIAKDGGLNEKLVIGSPTSETSLSSQDMARKILEERKKKGAR